MYVCVCNAIRDSELRHAARRTDGGVDAVYETLGCQVVGLRADGLNLKSQQAIEALGAKKDGALRHFQARPDGSPRDIHFYSILANEWPDVRRHLEARLTRHGMKNST